MATPSASTNPEQKDDSEVKPSTTQQSGDEGKAQSQSTSGIETNQGRSTSPSSEQSPQRDQPSDSNAEKKNEDTSSKTEHKEETRAASSSPSDQKDVKTETTTRTTTTSSADSTHQEESKSADASSEDTKKTESNLTAATSPPTPEKDVKQEQRESKPSSSDSSTNADLKKEQPTPQRAAPGADAFPIEKGNGQHLTDFQRQKAKYFFNVNLDIENKEFLKWDDVEFYLLFHVTAADKEGSNGGDLEVRLSRAARALWEHIHDQVPLADGKRDTLTLDQFLDTWASLADHVIQTNQLPPQVDDLVKLGFELYASEDAAGKKSIEPIAFDRLFQKTNLGRPYAIMAYKLLTDNGSTSLDASKIESIVRAVITSSDDEHSSHFLLPGFFKNIGNKKNRSRTPSPVEDKPSAERTSRPSSPSTSTSTTQKATTTESDKSNARPSTPTRGQQSGGTSPSRQSPKPREVARPASPKRTETPASSGQSAQGTTPSQKTPSTQQAQSQSPRAVIQQEDENIRRLLRYYHIDDGDLVEVSGGSVQRVVLVHPERPLPPYIQQNKELLQKLQSGSTALPANGNQQGAPPIPLTGKRPTVPWEQTKAKITLDERIARGEAQKGPSVPYRQESQSNSSSTNSARQVYPPLSPAEQEQQRRQAQLQAAAPLAAAQDVKSTSEAKAQTGASQAKSDDKKDVNHDDEGRIVAAILKQLAPLIQKRVSDEVRRLRSGDSDDEDDDDDDDGGFIPFPFMFSGPGPFFTGQPPAQAFQQQQQQQQGFSQGLPAQGMNFGGMPSGASFIPPQLLMAMMNDLAEGEMGGASGYPQRSGPPRF